MTVSTKYTQAGVDIQTGDDLVDWLCQTQPHPLPHQDRVLSGIGGFASLFRFDFPEMSKPCLVTCADGVGTKIKWAESEEELMAVGQDLVAMNVNDLICCGAKPMLFLDYYATGKLELNHAKAFLTGVRNACQKSDCLLIGGETAEMPGLYHGKDFDCAGFAVGVVDQTKILGAHRIQVGQKLIGVASSGFHSNGYSLVRKLFADDLPQWRTRLMQPTELYVRLVQKLVAQNLVEACAHITGGGLSNLLRVFPQGTRAEVLRWEFPEIFQEAQRRGNMGRDEMVETFNCGVGFVLIANEQSVAAISAVCQELQLKCFALGQVAAHPEGSAVSPDYVWL